MLKLNCFNTGLCELYVKLESQNPGGSIKDRVGLAIIEDAEKLFGIILDFGERGRGNASNSSNASNASNTSNAIKADKASNTCKAQSKQTNQTKPS